MVEMQSKLYPQYFLLTSELAKKKKKPLRSIALTKKYEANVCCKLFEFLICSNANRFRTIHFTGTIIHQKVITKLKTVP